MGFTGKLKGKSHERGGVPVKGTPIELEGGEFVVNKESAKKYLSTLKKINNDPSSVKKLKPLRRGGKNTAYDPVKKKKKRVKHASNTYRRGGKLSKNYPGMGD